MVLRLRVEEEMELLELEEEEEDEEDEEDDEGLRFLACWRVYYLRLECALSRLYSLCGFLSEC